MIRLDPVFCDGCVLPVQRQTVIFGTADRDGDVTCTLYRGGEQLRQGAGKIENGQLRAVFTDPLEPAEGLTLTVEAPAGRAVVNDVCAGLVFLAGGQSNMELALCNAEGGAEEVRTHDDPGLRWFMVPRESRIDRALAAREHDRWQCVTPGGCGEMSAVAYFFARRVRQETGMPMGIIGCYWGGTSIAAWIREDTLERLP